ncbi:MAG: galactokinase [Flavobacterium nitrogenifigens]|uniref:Galactokinase n=1 Tax=Flavobacterium nitrogenifigens TaxID=1617283 RepID=A0A521CR50_9FLAO|nr:galactokinase [Flavobacterium nitrogenifigens]KAF2328380.1 galactokinase [Flavobacterium nitrogenifigens]MDQ8011330.1 galactokinase [Flavobacterium nitrogenifigens]SMO61949.1 galactokinase [Flavobacterium nitrogenifigens]
MNDILIQNTVAFFEKSFGSSPQKTVLSPGRINIIGEHIDYNDGYVLPAAIDKVICFAFAKNNTKTSKVIAIDLNEEFEIDLTHEIKLSDVVWTNYIRGVIKQLQDNGFSFDGFNCVFSSNIPVGSGLSSSAALECGMIFGIKSLFDLKIEKKDISLLGQKAEHWVGINCGIMDQFSSVHGLENKVIQLDCNTLDFEYHNADFKDYSLILFDSNVKHSLFTSEYNTRRIECEEGLSIIKNHFPEVKTFRNATEEQVLSLKDKMTEKVFSRVHFVVKEINRVIKACEALDQGNIELLGELLFETHYGLSQEYEVSCEELDMLVDTAKEDDAIIGSRLMGGGFGGCTINLVKKGHENEVKRKFSKLYLDTFGIELKFYDVKISNGTTLL